MSRSRRARFGVGLAVVAMVTVAACGGGGSEQASSAKPIDGSWKDVVAAAEKEGGLLLYTNMVPALATKMAKDFNAQYPKIKLEFLRTTSGDMVPRLDQERASGAKGADVAINGEIDWFNARAKEGTLAPLGGPSIDKLPADATVGKDIGLVGVEPLAMSINTDLVKAVPTAKEAYEMTLDPKYAGKVGVPDAVSVPAMAYYAWLKETRGDKYLQNLGDQKPRIYDSSTPLAQAVASGEVAIGVYALRSTVEDLAKSGAPIKFVPTDPAVGNPFYVGALGWAKHPNAARVFVDWTMSEAGQKSAWGTGLGASPIGVAGSQDIKQSQPLKVAGYTAQAQQDSEAQFNKNFR